MALDNDWIANINDSGSDPTPAGGTVTYNISVTNSGADAAAATTVTLSIPATMTFIGSSGTITGCAPVPATGPSSVVCTVPPLASSAAATLVAQVRSSVQGSVTMGAAVSTTGDSDPANNDVTEITTITAGADVSLGLSGPATASAGGTATYVFTATNNGPNTVSSLVLSIPVPTGLANITPPSGCSLSAGTYSCTIAGPIAAGASVTRNLTGQISASSGSTVTMAGSIGTSVPTDPITTNNTATFNTTTSAGSDVSITKSRSPAGAVFVGDAVTFTLAGAYTGDSPSGLTITDTIPANYAITSVTPSGGSGWSCTTLAQTVTCTRTSGSGPGANVSLGSVAIATTATTSGSATNTATIAAAGPSDPDAANNSATDGGATITDPTSDLRANKSGPNPALMVIGNNYNFIIDTTNLGNSPFSGTLVMTDTLPAGLTVTGFAPNGWSCLPAAPVAGPTAITCQRVYTPGAPLAVNATTPTVTLTTQATAAGSLVNAMTVSSPDATFPDPANPNNTATYAVTAADAPASADVSVVKSASPATLAAGDVATFAIEVRNTGPVASTNVTLTDDLNNLINNGVGAAGQGLVSVASSSGSATGLSCATASTGGTSRRLTCTIANLPVCTSGVDCPTVTIQVRPGGNAGARSNQATAISSTIPDPNLANNTSAAASASFDVTAKADVTVSKIGTPNPVAAGQNLTYVVTATNAANGLSAADNVTIDDTLPLNVTFVSASPSAGSCSTAPASGSTTTAGSRHVICNFGTINNGAQRTVTVIVRPNTITRGTTLNNAASVTTTTPETDSGNNTTSIGTDVSNPALDLLVNKIDSVDPVSVGSDTVYTISVTNLGPSAAENVVVNDPMPATNLAYRSFTISGSGSCGTVPAVDSLGGTLQCSFPTLPSGQSETVTVTMRGVAKGTATNTATVSSDESVAGFDTNLANNTEGEVTTVRTRADVAVTSKTATPGTVNLRDPFSYAVVVENLTGPLLAEADNTIVSDGLPSGMVLTGTPSIVVNAGSVTTSTCTGAAGATSFTCDLGTFSSGGRVTITVPVKVTTVAALPATLTNTASVTTSSFDVNSANDTNSGPVTINSSSIAGNVFRDFAADGAISGGDTGIGGVVLTLTGTALDGTAISATATTAPDGSYIFRFVPEGSYAISRGTVSEAHLTNGTNSAGTAGGATPTATSTTGINLPAATAATGYLFPLIPQARIGVAKAVQAGPTINADASYNVTFRFTVRNLSLEALNTVALTDSMAGGAPGFGTFVSLAAPAISPMSPGSYTILSAPAGSCGGGNAGFDGSGATTLASGFSVAAGASCTVDVALRVQPTVPLPPVRPSGGRYENQATVTGTGALSGQTSGTNPQLTDLSDNGSTVDPNGNGLANEAGENDPTPVNPTYAPAIALVKTVDTGALSSPVVAGDVLTYHFAITNTGNVTLSNVTLSDPLPGLTISGGPIATLAPGATDSATFTGTLTLTQPQVDAGSLTNQATTSGTDPLGTAVSDLSGTAVGNDTPLTTTLNPGPSIALVKSADASAVQNPAQVGDVISYAFTVTNTGNVTLTNVSLSDPLAGLVLAGGPIASLAPGASNSTTFTATYALTQADLDAGQVQNQATATGKPPTGPNVTDLSGTLATTDDPTVVPLTQGASITLVKTADTSGLALGANVGDTIPYSFVITNTGNVTLTNVTLNDPLAGLVLSGGPIASLAPGASNGSTFTASYVVTAGDLAAGQVVNTATVTGHYGPAGALTVTAQSTATAPVVSIHALPEVFPAFTTDGGTTTSMLASDTVAGAPATLSNVTITALASSDPAVTLAPLTGLITLAPGQPAGVYTVDYRICSTLVPTVCDTATETVYQAPIGRLDATKTEAVTDNGDGVTGVGDTVTYTIAVKNLSNSDVDGLTLADTFTTIDGVTLALDSGPTFVSADAGSAAGTLKIGETATYTASYVLTVNAVSHGGLRNQVTANANTIVPAGVPATPVPVSDVSDNGNDVDGNTTNDPTVLRVNASLAAQGLTVTKTTPHGIVTRGATVPYTITVRNDNPVVSGTLNVVDALPPGFFYVPGSATLGGTPVAVTVAGRIVTWPNVPVPPLTTISLTLNARVTTSAPTGESVNHATIRNPSTNALLAPEATATVRILPEPVFDCGDVIGKVFEDRNHDGYQNDPGPGPIIADDTVAGGKFGTTAPAVEPDRYEEKGIAGVRLVGVDGTIITTDAFGRFHVPCAMLPERHGSNFILKLDTRSLPAGYRLTTENPRVVRLTPGKMTELNFGVAIAKVVRVDLNAQAFAAAGGGLSPGLDAAIRQLVPTIAGDAPTVRLVYHLPDGADHKAVALAEARMNRVRQAIEAAWKTAGRTKLTVEMTVVRSNG